MERPKLKSKNISDESTDSVTYHIEGDLVPALTLELTLGQSVMFEYHVMSWKTPALMLSQVALDKRYKRAAGGVPAILMQTEGEGTIAFSRHAAGTVFPIRLLPGESIDVRERLYLAATCNLSYDFKQYETMSSVMYGGTGFFVDEFKTDEHDGIVWVHAYGDVFEVVLGEGEQIDIDSGSWVYKDHTVKMTPKKQHVLADMLDGRTLVSWRFTGPGRVGIQTVSLTMNPDSSIMYADKKGVVGFVFGLLRAFKKRRSI